MALRQRNVGNLPMSPMQHFAIWHPRATQFLILCVIVAGVAIVRNPWKYLVCLPAAILLTAVMFVLGPLVRIWKELRAAKETI